MNIEDFIERAKEVHNNKYIYSLVTRYENNKEKIDIICPIHGIFSQRIDKHLQGSGCPQCANKYSGSKYGKKTTGEFILQAREIHGNKYDYSKVEYINAHTKVCIICPEHGEFWQRPCNHLNGNGCKKCGAISGHNLQRKHTNYFVEKAQIIHDNKYDYSKVNYIDNKTNVCIICPKHGEFWQKPNNHLNGAGCPICNESHLERNTAKYLDHVNIAYEREKNWEWLKNIKPLHVDFYLPYYNIVIECQGKQHFKNNESFGSKKTSPEEIYEYVNLIDNIKFKKCEEHNIPIEYINYNDDIEKRICEIIDKHKNKGVTDVSPTVNADE